MLEHSNVARLRPRLTYREFGLEKLYGLTEGLGLAKLSAPALTLFDLLVSPYGDLPLGGEPLWPSDITDDGTPFELSVAFSHGRPLLRVLSEAQRAPFDAQSGWEAALALNERLARLPGVNLERFERVAPIFAPRAGATPRFTLWHAGTVEPDGRLSFKVYLNPRIAGDAHAPELVRAALVACGAAYAWPRLAERLTANTDVLYFSLDLCASKNARVKVYIGHRGATSSSIDAEVRHEPGYTPGLAESWVEMLTGSEGPFEARPILTCHAFRGPDREVEVTVHVPTRSYVDSDGESALRASELLDAVSAKSFVGGLKAMARRPLELGRSLLTYVSLRPEADGPRVTAYLAPEAFAISTARPTARPTAHLTEASPQPFTLPPPSASSLPPPRDTLVRALRHAGKAPSWTFGEVESLIFDQRDVFSKHPFLRRLEGSGHLAEVSAVAPRLTFFVMVFQDILRLARALSTDPVLKELAINHEAEDRGHDAWFLDDLKILASEPNVTSLFSDDHAPTRDIAYKLVSLVLRAQNDATRLSVLLALEGAGAEFFGRIIGFLERLGRTEGLAYFARSHQTVEQNHDVFGESTHDRLTSMRIEPAAVPEVIEAIDATFAAMSHLANVAEEASAAALHTPANRLSA